MEGVLAGTKPDGSKYKILITDDAAFMLKQYEQLLKRGGYEVVGEARDGEQAVKMYKELKPDAVIMDITMPNMDGIEAIKAIVGSDKNARILVSSALGKEETVKRAIGAGARHYVVKPLQDEQFLKALNQILQ